MSSNEPLESAPGKRYRAAIVVPLVAFVLLAGFAAGYSIGQLGHDECRRQRSPDTFRDVTTQHSQHYEQDVSKQPGGARTALPRLMRSDYPNIAK